MAGLLLFFTEQVVDGHAESVGQILELVVCDHSVARLDPADGLLRDVKPAIWILYARRSCERSARSLASRTRSPEMLHRPYGLYIFKYAPPPFMPKMPI